MMWLVSSAIFLNWWLISHIHLVKEKSLNRKRRVENNSVNKVNSFQSASLEEQMITTFYIWHLQGHGQSGMWDCNNFEGVELIMQRLELLILSLFLGWMSSFSCYFPCGPFFHFRNQRVIEIKIVQCNKCNQL
jgi:hypothetical protein